ncbi:MAG: hypothetical protein HC828_13570 [Blastochloris sp.]|nr:hypothetical protein [Blastochloris sp.]
MTSRRLGVWLYPLTLMLMAFLLVMTFAGRPAINWLDVLQRLIANLAFFQLVLLCWFITSAVARNRPSTRDWLWATGVAAPTLAVGQLLTLLAVAVVSGLLALAAGCSAMLISGMIVWANLGAYWLLGSALMLPITLFQFGVVAALALMLRRTLPVVIIVAVVYMLLVLGFLVPYQTLFNPLNYTLQGLQFDSVAGVAADQPLLTTLFWLYLSLVVVLPILALWLSTQLDWRLGWQPWQRRWFRLLLTLGIVSSIGAGSAYALTVHQRTVPPPVRDQLDAWQVTQANHSGTVQRDTLRVTASLQLVNTTAASQSEIVLRLNPGLQVEQAQVNGQAATSDRAGEVVRLQRLAAGIAPGQTASVALVYAGTPVLLREDYAPPLGGPNGLPTRFARPVRNYITSDLLMLQRDGDWRVWPQTTAPYIAQQDAITLTVNTYPTLISSSYTAEQTAAGAAYQWKAPIPQLLLAAGNYPTQQSANDLIAMPPFGDQRDTARAEQALAARRAIEPYLGRPIPATLDLVFLPYSRDVVAGGAMLGVPATNLQLVSVNSFDLYQRWANGILAVQIAQALLADTVAWPIDRQNINGQIGSFAAQCSGGTSEQTCTATSTGGISPQAPNGRITEPPAAPLLQAWSIVVGRYVAPGVLDAQTIAQERAMWQEMGGTDQGQAFNSSFELRSRGLMSRSTLPDQMQTLARLVVQIDGLYQAYGPDRSAQLLRELAQPTRWAGRRSPTRHSKAGPQRKWHKRSSVG